MATQIEQPTEAWRSASVESIRQSAATLRPVTTGEMLRRFDTDEALNAVHTAQASKAARPRTDGGAAEHAHASRRSSYIRLRRERVLMVLATVTFGLCITGLAYVALLVY